MYRMTEMEETVRIPPPMLGGDMGQVLKRLVHETFEGRMDKQRGMTVLVTEVSPVGEGRIVHGDGGVYQRVKFRALTFKPEVNEVVEGTVCEVVEFGAFIRFGPLDGLLHMSQIMNDYLNVDLANMRLVGKESGRFLKVDDTVRCRIVTASLNETSPRESKIGLTMRQPGLGKHDWLEEDRAEKEGGGKPKGAGKQKKAEAVEPA